MPQMSPLMWTSLLIYTSLCLMLFLSKITVMKPIKINSMPPAKMLNNKFLW